MRRPFLADPLPPLMARARAFVVAQAQRRRAVRRAIELLWPAQRDVRRTRRRLAAQFLHGQGLEIGALHLPLPAPRGVRVRYVDRMDVAGLRREYPELRSYDLVEVDVVDDGERLASIGDGSVDFVIANHFIEHTEDPIATLHSHSRVLRPGGVLFLAVPDKRRSFDVERPVTPLAHVVRDFTEGPAWSRREHFEEWVRSVEHTPERDVTARSGALQAEGYSIHFHVWDPAAFAELLVHARAEQGVPLALEALVPVRHEFIAILRRL
jgi:SAM-dependent methyltransferase